MDFRELLKKIDTIAEADATGRIDYQANKAQDAREAAIAQVKQWMSTPLSGIARLGVAIDPKTGIIYYGDAGNGRNGPQDGYDAKPYPYDWLKNPSSTSTQSVQIYQVLGPAGLKVIPVEKKTLFGSTQVAGISPQQLADIDKPVAPVAPVKDPNAPPVPVNGKCPDGWTISPDGKSCVKAGANVPVKNDDHVARLNALNAKLAEKLKAAKLEGKSITKELVESFGYNIPEGYHIDERGMLVEWEWKDVRQGAADGLRGFSNGVTFGAADNIAAGVNSAFSKDTYAQALAKEKADTAAAEKRASSVKFKDPIFGKEWNPNMYDAGNLVGMVATPIPGGAVANAAIKGTSTAAKVGRGLVDVGTNVAATMAADAALDSHNSATLGKDWKEKADAAAGQAAKPTPPAPAVPPGGDPKVFALQQQLIAKGAKIKADGFMGPKTQAAMTQFKVTMPQESVAEAMSRLRDRMALIEREQRGYSDVAVGETIKGDVGKAAVEKASELGGKAVDAVKGWFGKGADAEAKAAAEKAATKAPEKAATKAPEKAAEKTATKAPEKAPEKSTVHKAKDNNPNKKDQTPYVQGRAGNGTGSDATKFAKYDPATSAMANVEQGVNNMVRNGQWARAGEEQAARAAASTKSAQAALDAERAALAAEKEAGKLPQATSATGPYSVRNPYAVAGAAERDAASLAGREAGAAERDAAGLAGREAGAAERDAASLAGREAGAAERDAAGLASREAGAAERGASRELTAAEREAAAAGRTGKGSNWKKWAGIAAGTGLAARLLSPDGGGDVHPTPPGPTPPGPTPPGPTPPGPTPPGPTPPGPTPPGPTPPGPTPPGPNGDEDFSDIIKQMKALMAGYADDQDPEWGQATSTATSLIGRAEKSPNKPQIALDAEAGGNKPNALKTPRELGSAPGGSDTPTVKNNTDTDSLGGLIGQSLGGGGKAPATLGETDELARWLRIARGR